jgi:PPOX class probable F420-dependent enzyme
MAIETAPTAHAGASAQLTRAQFIRLITYRRTGDAVATPVWFTLEGDTIYVETSINAGKIKRIRHTPHVGLAPSDARGRVTGPMWEGTARILADQDEIARADAALAHKYGLQHTLYFGALDLMRRLTRKPALDAAYLAITLEEVG